LLTVHAAPASGAPVGKGVPLPVLGLEGEEAHDVAAQTLTNELRQVVVESSGHALFLSNPALMLAAGGAKCDLAPFGRRYGPDSDRGIDAGCQRSMAVRLGAKQMLWGHLYEEGNVLRVKMHLFREGSRERVETLSYDAAAPKRLARRLYLKLVTPEAVGDARLEGDAALEGSELWVDGKAEGPYAPGLELTLPAGEHSFELRRESRVVGRATSSVVAGKTTEVRLAFVPRTDLDPAAGFRDPPPVTVTPGSAWKWPAGFVGLGLGAVLLGAGVLSSVRVNAIKDDFSSERSLVTYRSGVSGDPCDAAASGARSAQASASTAARFDRLCSGSSTFEVAQYVFYGVSALAVGAGAYFLASAPRAGASAASPAAWSLHPWGGPTSGGLGLSASF
jgi:hypothetical protein